MRWRWPVGILIAIAAAILLWVWSGDEGAPLDQGGPLFPHDTARITQIEVQQPDGAVTVRRGEDGWVLTGLVDDLVDAGRIDALLAALTAANGGQVLPGSEPGARQYGFGGPGALEIAITLEGRGEPWRLAIGEQNVVTGNFYASGAGRRGVFPVAARLHELWVRVPEVLRLRTLLPPEARGRVEAVRVAARDGGEPLLLIRRDGRWWLREPAGGPEALGREVARYNALYDDRRATAAGLPWLRASDRAVTNLIHEITATPVQDFGPQDPAPRWLAEIGLVPPYRTVTLSLRGRTEPHVVELGEIQTGPSVWARRDGAVVLARGDALATVEQPFSHLVDLGALSFRVALADSFHLDGSRGPLLWGRRPPAPVTDVWLPTVPPGLRLRVPADRAGELLGDLQVTLDRLDQTGILPPVASDPLGPDDRTRLVAWYPGGVRHEVVLGRLADGGGPAVWTPRTGQVLRVDEEILVTLRALGGLLAR